MTKAKVTFVMESELKQQFAEACANIGLSMNRALNTLIPWCARPCAPIPTSMSSTTMSPMLRP